MSNTAAYILGQLVKLIETTAPKELRVFVNTTLSGKLGETLGIVSAHWMDKCRKQLTTREARDAFDDKIGALLDGVAVENLEVHWDDQMRGQYMLGYMQNKSGVDNEELTVTEAAGIAGVERQTILSRIKAGSLPGRKDRGRWMVRRTDLEAWQPDRTGPKKG